VSAIASDDAGRWVISRQNRGKLIKRSQAGGLEVVPNGRDDWIGWVELTLGRSEAAGDHQIGAPSTSLRAERVAGLRRRIAPGLDPLYRRRRQ